MCMIGSENQHPQDCIAHLAVCGHGIHAAIFVTEQIAPLGEPLLGVIQIRQRALQTWQAETTRGE